MADTGRCDRLRDRSYVAVQAHVYYDDLIEEVTSCVNNISVPYDMFVSTDSREKAGRISAYLSEHSTARKITVEVYDNVGRDVIPFIRQMGTHKDDYEYICHLHTKKTNFNPELGELWRRHPLRC